MLPMFEDSRFPKQPVPVGLPPQAVACVPGLLPLVAQLVQVGAPVADALTTSVAVKVETVSGHCVGCGFFK